MTEQTDIELIGTPEHTAFGFTSNAIPSLIRGVRINGIEVTAETIVVASEEVNGMALLTVTVKLIPDSLRIVVPEEGENE